MSVERTDTATDDPGLLRKAYRTVTPAYRSHDEGSMDVVGWSMVVGLVALLLPLLPFLVVVWVLTRVVDFVAAQVGGDDAPEAAE